MIYTVYCTLYTVHCTLYTSDLEDELGAGVCDGEHALHAVDVDSLRLPMRRRYTGTEAEQALSIRSISVTYKCTQVQRQSRPG